MYDVMFRTQLSKMSISLPQNYKTQVCAGRRRSALNLVKMLVINYISVSLTPTATIQPSQGGTRPIFWDETETEKLGLSKITTRPRPRNSGC